MVAFSERKREPKRPEPRGASRLDAVARWGYWTSLATLAFVWTVCVYLPDRQGLRVAQEQKTELLQDVNELTHEVKRLIKSEQLLEAEAPYLWDRVYRTRLNWTAPGERRIDDASQGAVVVP